MIYKVTVDGTVFPPLDADDLELGEKETLEQLLGVKFDDEGKPVGANASGFTIGVIYLAWKRVDQSASLAKVRKLRTSQYEVEEVEPSPPAEVVEEVGGAVVTLDPSGPRPSPASTESNPGTSTASA